MSGKAGDLAFRVWDDKAFKNLRTFFFPERRKVPESADAGIIAKMLRGLLGRERISGSLRLRSGQALRLPLRRPSAWSRSLRMTISFLLRIGRTLRGINFDPIN